MYTASLFKKELLSGKIVFTVVYTNGIDSFSEVYNFIAANGLKNFVTNRLVELNLTDGSVVGPIDTSITSPTQAELDRSDWLFKYRQWVKVKATLIDTGILTGNETQVVNLKSAVQSGFKASYLNDI